MSIVASKPDLSANYGIDVGGEAVISFFDNNIT